MPLPSACRGAPPSPSPTPLASPTHPTATAPTHLTPPTHGSYAFTWQHSPGAFSDRALHWPPPGFTHTNASQLLSRLWRRERQRGTTAFRPDFMLPQLPPDHPQRVAWLKQEVVLWNELLPLDPTVGLAPTLLRGRADLLPGFLEPRQTGAWRLAAQGAAQDRSAPSLAAEPAAVHSRQGAPSKAVDLVGP